MPLRARVALCAVALLLAAGCATPIGVRRVEQRQVYRELGESALSTGSASVVTRQVLLRDGLYERFVEDPADALEALHQLTLAETTGARLFALAEGSQLHAERSGKAGFHLAAALYAYAYLLPEDGSPGPDLLDPRLRVVVDLYNRALSDALVAAGGPERLAALALPAHVGRMQISFEPESLHWAGRRLTELTPTSDLEVRGLRNRYRRPGIGAAFAAAAVAEPGAELEPRNALVAERVRLPISFFLRIEAPRASLARGEISAVLELHNSRDVETLDVAGREVAIEFETSAALALGLDGAPVWDTEIAGFRNPQAVPEEGLLRMWGPHRRGRIPVVLVHGTASSAARWAEMLNELESDAVIRHNFEFWFFTYPTGGPILYSANLLRSWLGRVVAELDPEGTDPGLRRMVLVGHSQGGLLCKLQVVDSETRFWDFISKTPFDQVKLSSKTHELLKSALFVKPLPYVRRVIFISTPQRGSYIAGNWIGRLATKLTQAPGRLVSLPLDLAKAGIALPGTAVDLATGDEGALVERRLERLPSSVDNMNPSNPMIQTLAALPIDPRVSAHSIIPVKGGPPPDGQNDGVVAYASAHIDGVESEFVVFHTSHSAQSAPQAIQEVRRILLEHLAAAP
jgi:hypothetical protein